MFDIYTNHTIESVSELENYVSELSNIISDTESVKSNLGSLTQMDEVIMKLSRAIDDMEDENQTLKQLTQGLNKLTYCYITAENRICDNTEQNVIRYVDNNPVSVDLGNIAGMLKDVNL